MKRNPPSVSRRAIVHTAALTAAILGSAVASSASASVLYTWNTFPAAGTASYSDGTQWTASNGTANANNYPGGDATVLDDAAMISPTAGGYGTFTINYTGMNAATISALTIKGGTGAAATDTLTFNATAPLTVTGSITLNGTSNTTGPVIFNANSTNISTAGVPASGVVTLNINGTSNFTSTGAFGGNSSKLAFTIANGSTASFGGLTAGSGNSVISGTVNGNLTTTSYTTNGSADSGNLTISSTAGTVNLGNVSLERTSGTTATASATGIHIKGGIVSMNNTQIGITNSAAALEVGAGSLTIGGTFNLGQNSGGRTSVTFVDGGTLLDTNAAGLIVGQVSNLAVGGGGTGSFNVTGGTATLEKITLGGIQTTTASAATGNNSANLSVTGGALYLGSGGIVATATPFSGTTIGSAYNVALTGGTIGAKAAWSSSANMAVNTNTVTFQSADASANPFDISLTGNLTGNGSLAKTGGGNLTLGGTVSYSGATSVTAGTLLVTGAITAGTSASVASGATLGGSGSITPAVTDSGTINPGATGAGSIGTLSIGGGLTLADNATYAVDFNAASSDKLAVTGNIALGNNDTLAMNDLDATTAGSYVIATYTGTESGTFANLPANVSVDYTTGNAITVTIGAAVPEPASLTLLSLGAAALLTRRRKI
jgi:hypothetical protein